MTDWSFAKAPTLDDFELLAKDALETLPQPFRDLVKDVRCFVAEFPEDDVLDDLGIESEFDLMGLFTGVGMAQEGIVPTGRLPNTVHLYRRPILDYWAEHEEALGDVIGNVLVHEIGHHFGLSDDDMEAIEAAAD